MNGMELPITQAIVLAAGRGARFRPVTDAIPKPLVPLGGKPLIDWQLERLKRSGVERVVINCCYLKELLKQHVTAQDYGLDITFSEEDVALETGGGIKRALPYLDDAPFYAINSDVVFWPENPRLLQQLDRAFALRPEVRLALLLQPNPGTIGIRSAGDFFCDEYGHIWRRGVQKEAPYIFSGVQLMRPDIFDGMEDSIFSMNVIYDRLIKGEKEAIAGIINNGGMMLHVGDPEGHRASEAFLNEALQQNPAPEKIAAGH